MFLTYAGRNRWVPDFVSETRRWQNGFVARLFIVTFKGIAVCTPVADGRQEVVISWIEYRFRPGRKRLAVDNCSLKKYFTLYMTDCLRRSLCSKRHRAAVSYSANLSQKAAVGYNCFLTSVCFANISKLFWGTNCSFKKIYKINLFKFIWKSPRPFVNESQLPNAIPVDILLTQIDTWCGNGTRNCCQLQSHSGDQKVTGVTNF